MSALVQNIATLTSTDSRHAPSPAPAPAPARIEELGRIIMAYSEITERLQESHQRLEQTVRELRDELSEKNRLLERKNRLAALGEMAAGMAHEIRNPLGGIQLYASMLQRDLKDHGEAAAVVGKITAGVHRLEDLVSQILQFTRDLRPSIVTMDLAHVVREAVEMAGQSQTIEVYGPFQLLVQADPLLIGQAILNLLRNALEAARNGPITLRYGAKGTGPEVRQFWIAVEDEGPGVSATIMDRIFNPFFTTKENGTGLGLAMVHRVIEAHDGTIVVTNRPAGGARFEIRL